MHKIVETSSLSNWSKCNTCARDITTVLTLVSTVKIFFYNPVKYDPSLNR